MLAAAVIVVLAGLYLWARRALRREPYRTLANLPVRRKVAFLKSLLKDPRVPLWIKTLPFLLAAYLALPIDLVPDFIPVLGFLDDVAMFLLVAAAVIRFTPRDVLQQLLDRATEGK